MPQVEVISPVRGAVGGPRQAGVNGFGDLFTAGGAVPRYAEMARRGNGYATMATAAVAALVVRPSTTAALEIQNVTAGKVMVIDRLFSHELVTSTTGLGGGAVIYAMVTRPVPVLITDAALAINSLSGKAPLGKQVFTAASTTVADNGWFPYGTTVKKESAGAVVPGGGLEALIEGRLLVPAMCSLCLHVVSGYVGDTFTSGVAFYWEDDDMIDPVIN